AGVGLGETNAFLREPVDVRSGDQLLPVATEVAVAEVVSDDQDDVRLSGRQRDRAEKSYGEQRENLFHRVKAFALSFTFSFHSFHLSESSRTISGFPVTRFLVSPGSFSRW